MNIQNKCGLRVLAVFLIILLVLTFLSKTIYNSTLPQVETARIQSGTLRWTVSDSTFWFESDCHEVVRMGQILSDSPLLIETVCVQNMDFFQKGDVLIIFDDVLGEHALSQAQEAYQNSLTELKAWDIQWQQAWNKLQLERLTIEIDAQELDIDAAIIAQRRKNLVAELEFLIQDNVVNGKTRNVIEARCQKAAATVEFLEELCADKWRIRAQENGIVSNVMVKAGDYCETFMPLVRWLPLYDTSLKIGIRCNQPIDSMSMTDVRVTSVDRVTYLNSETEWEFVGSTIRDGEQLIWARTSDIRSVLPTIQSLVFEFHSEYMPLLIPNEALIDGGMIYILESQTGAWGNEECTVREVAIQVQQSDDLYTAISGEIQPSKLVVVYSNRTLDDGDVVLIR